MIELILELLLGFFGEILLEGALLMVGNSDRAQRRALKMFLFAFIGAAAGWLSVAIFPTHFIRDPQWRVASLVVSPFLVAYAFGIIGRLRERKGKQPTSLEEFWPAYAFALAMAGMRYFGAG